MNIKAVGTVVTDIYHHDATIISLGKQANIVLTMAIMALRTRSAQLLQYSHLPILSPNSLR